MSFLQLSLDVIPNRISSGLYFISRYFISRVNKFFKMLTINKIESELKLVRTRPKFNRTFELTWSIPGNLPKCFYHHWTGPLTWGWRGRQAPFLKTIKLRSLKKMYIFKFLSYSKENKRKTAEDCQDL